MDSATLRSSDRISMLPDSILCHILSFLPTKYSVQTSILSTRYQYLWTYITSLRLSNSEFLTDDIGEDEANLSFTNFVSTVLLLGNLSCLEKFRLELKSFQNIDIVKSWISTAIKHNVQRLYLRHLEGNNGELPIELPRSMFISKTLVKLTLDGLIFLEIPTSVWLPSLKILKMVDLMYENGDSAQKLLPGCPVLEYLYVHRGLYRKSTEVFNISVPTLKHLVVIDPDLTCDSPEGFSLENLSSLLEAHIELDLPIHLTNILTLLRGIANVKCLQFHAKVGDYVLPTFPTLRNLTHLRLLSGVNIGNSGFNLNLLNDFLECSPNLEVLVLEGNRCSSTKSWGPPLRVPHCLLFRLKEVEFQASFGRKALEFELDFEVIKYLLKSAEVLKKMTIRSQLLDSPQIAQFPRASKACIISFKV